MRSKLLLIVFLLVCSMPCYGADSIFLRDNLRRAEKGDFIVTAQNKNYSLLLIQDKKENNLIVEEISVPSSKLNLKNFSWREWVRQGAPANTSWVRYTIDLSNAQMTDYFSFTKNGWFDVAQQDNFLTTLLNLRMQKVPRQQMRRIGVSNMPSMYDKRAVWQPKMMVDGEEIQGVAFDAWKTTWPKDGGELSGKTIEVYVPEENSSYPSYFPYWLQISGLVGKAKVRIVDSGNGLVSPAPAVLR